jgi:hypothetical protein
MYICLQTEDVIVSSYLSKHSVRPHIYVHTVSSLCTPVFVPSSVPAEFSDRRQFGVILLEDLSK